jgi:hypothetical protein
VRGVRLLWAYRRSAILIREGHIPRKVNLGKGREAEFWTVRRELWIRSPNAEVQCPYFDPAGYADDELPNKVSCYCTFS